jgi:thiol-disulfide isomerase/thioredoxin
MVYVKGLIGALALALILFLGWKALDNRLSTQKMPERYDIIDSLEKDGMRKFSLPNMDGSTFDLESVRGKVILLNFWASWCEPCVREYPSMTKLANHFKGDLVFIAISNDEEKENIDKFLGAMGESSPHTIVLWDKDRTVADQYGVERLPETFIFNKEGKLDRKIIGQTEWYEEGALSYIDALISN